MFYVSYVLEIPIRCTIDNALRVFRSRELNVNLTQTRLSHGELMFA